MHLVFTLSGMLLINIRSNIWSCATLMVWFVLRVVWRKKEQGDSITGTVSLQSSAALNFVCGHTNFLIL